MKLLLTLTSLAFAIALPTEPTEPDHTKIIPIMPIPVPGFKLASGKGLPGNATKKNEPTEPDHTKIIPIMPIPVPAVVKKNEICGYPEWPASLFSACEEGLTCLPAPCRQDRMGSTPDRYVCTTEAAIKGVMCLS